MVHIHNINILTYVAITKLHVCVDVGRCWLGPVISWVFMSSPTRHSFP